MSGGVAAIRARAQLPADARARTMIRGDLVLVVVVMSGCWRRGRGSGPVELVGVG